MARPPPALFLDQAVNNLWTLSAKERKRKLYTPNNSSATFAKIGQRMGDQKLEVGRLSVKQPRWAD
jgi:hypothetical protein